MKDLNELKSPLIIALFIVVGLGIVAAIVIHYNSETITSYSTVILAMATVLYAILTIGLVSETGQYVRLTDQLVSETKKTREVLTNPKILVEAQPRFIWPSDSIREEERQIERRKNPDIDVEKSRVEFELIFRNIGPGPAYDITPKIIDIKKIDFDNPNVSPVSLDYLKKLINELSKRLSGLRPFERGIDYIAPNDKRLFFLWSVNIIFDYITLAEYLANYTVKIKIDYHKYPKEMREGFEKPQFTDTYLIDFSYPVESIPSIMRAAVNNKANFEPKARRKK
ncbi:MAG: hypothetical protein WCE81_02140 [Halobacteriota archaeon]